MSKTILIDDNYYDLLILQKLIEINNLSQDIVKFSSPLEALDFINQQKDDEKYKVFLDIMMPDLNGMEFLNHIRNWPENKLQQLEIFLVSSTLDPSDIRQAKEDPLVKDLLLKPVTIDMLNRAFMAN